MPRWGPANRSTQVRSTPPIIRQKKRTTDVPTRRRRASSEGISLKRFNEPARSLRATSNLIYGELSNPLSVPDKKQSNNISPLGDGGEKIPTRSSSDWPRPSHASSEWPRAPEAVVIHIIFKSPSCCRRLSFLLYISSRLDGIFSDLRTDPAASSGPLGDKTHLESH